MKSSGKFGVHLMVDGYDASPVACPHRVVQFES